ncbi:MAG: DUF1995 family protein [Oscillatoriales cyanobacterium SM2_2_1]|nr:DUF1995 family protein [Oscillatoriales cyanobacterium SM2_2_1]
MDRPDYLPDSLEAATAEAIAALRDALAAGCTRAIIDLRFAELNVMPVAYEVAQALTAIFGDEWQALFTDAGTAALAKRDWQDVTVPLRGVNEGRAAVRESDRAFLLVSPSATESDGVEKLLERVGDRPFMMLNPRLENAEVGLGLAARRLRERLMSRFEVIYYLQPLDARGAIHRVYPQPWEVWQQTEEGMTLMKTLPLRPTTDELDRIFRQQTGTPTTTFLSRLQQFFNALSR